MNESPHPLAEGARTLAGAFAPMSAALAASPILGPFWKAAVKAEELQLRERQRIQAAAPDLLLIYNRAIDERDAETARRLRSTADKIIGGPPHWRAR